MQSSRRLAFLATTILCLSVLPSNAVLAAPKAQLWVFWDQSAQVKQITNTEDIDHSLWQTFLDKYLVADDESGINLVRYAAIANSASPSNGRKLISQYLDLLQAIDPRTLSKDQQFAYWVNLYNAATINVIVQAYPVESIRKTGKRFFSFGPWDDVVLNIAGQDITLNDIEHRILRPIWQDPRIHFVVNCASIGCPNLPTTALTASNYLEILESAETQFINHPRAVSINEERVTLSSIFDWYAQDFGNNQTEVLSYIARRLPEERASAVQNPSADIRYTYDWQLNDCAGKSNTDC